MAGRDNPGAQTKQGGHGAGSGHSGGGFFEIRVRGQLDSHWSDWLEGLEVKSQDAGETVLAGYIVDQAALLGILNKVNRLNLALLSVTETTKES